MTLFDTCPILKAYPNLTDYSRVRYKLVQNILFVVYDTNAYIQTQNDAWPMDFTLFPSFEVW